MTNGADGPATIRDFDPATDAAWFLTLNNAHISEIGEATENDLAALVSQALAVRVAERRGTPVGVLVGLGCGLDYDSLNYRWFADRDAAPFFYVDRVIVAPEAAGSGVGRALYEDAAHLARAAGIARLVCEVNERPPNPGSLAFHERMGFAPLLTRENEESGKRVVMMEKRLPR